MREQYSRTEQVRNKSMKYIIMCGGTYRQWEAPRQLTRIRGEPIVARTIRLLKENGVSDIAISSGDDIFSQFGVPILKHENSYLQKGYNDIEGQWCDAFYPTDEPTCYIFGDVVFSPEAIKTIVETETDSIEFFASAPPFAPGYEKPWAEPFALKVEKPERLRDGVRWLKRYDEEGLFNRKPIMWELWAVITGGNLNRIDYNSYIVINDYTCDIDYPDEAAMFEMRIK